MVPLIALAAMLVASRPDTEPLVSIGPAALTLPEIARALSVEGRSVTCAAGLRNRGAVVCLRKRTWSDACRILAKGLDVRIRRHPDLADTWLLEADPEEAAREKQMRTALAGLLRAAVEKDIAPLRPTFSQPVHTLAERHARMEAALTRLEKTDPEHTRPQTQQLAEEIEKQEAAGDPFQQVAARLAAAHSVSSYENALRWPELFRPADIHRIVDVPALCRLMLMGMEEEAANAPPDAAGQAEVPNDPFMSIPAMRTLLARVAAGQIALEQRIYFDPGNFRVTAQQLYSIGGPIVFRHGITAQITDENGIAGVLRRMGGEAAARLGRNETDTARWRSTASAKQPFTIEWTEEVSSLSQLVEQWAKQTHGEAVMELAPLREGVDVTHAAENGGNADPPPSAVRVSLAQAIRADGSYPWSVEDSGGVLLVRSPLAFMDRGGNVPIPALLRLERAIGTQTARQISLADLATLHTSCTALESAGIRYCGAGYRGLDTSNLASSRFAIVLRRLSSRDRGAMLARLHATGVVDVPVRSLSPREVQEIVSSLRAIALCEENGDDTCWLPDIERMVSSGTLRLEREDIGTTVRLLIPPITPGDAELHELASTRLRF